jgi:DNA-binding GntR family transcriptional regulator
MSGKLKYVEIYNDIKQNILDSVYEVNKRLPDGSALSAKYNVSVLTIKKALDMLVKEGFIVRRRGDGSFVKNFRRGDLEVNKRLSGTYNRFNGKVKTKVIKFEIEKCDKNLASKLSIAENDFIYSIIRLRIIEDLPSIMEYSYIPLNIIKGLKYEDLQCSIYNFITNNLKLKIQSSWVGITGVRPNELEKRFLNMDDNDFLMQIKQIAYLSDSKTFEYSISNYISEKFHFETILVKS